MKKNRWALQGRKKQRRLVKKEIKAMGLTWSESEMAVLNRIGWRQRVDAHAPLEDKSKKKTI